jgi:hypothetical protein
MRPIATAALLTAAVVGALALTRDDAESREALEAKGIALLEKATKDASSITDDDAREMIRLGALLPAAGSTSTIIAPLAKLGEQALSRSALHQAGLPLLAKARKSLATITLLEANYMIALSQLLAAQGSTSTMIAELLDFGARRKALGWAPA